jgi:hypothetical protein
VALSRAVIQRHIAEWEPKLRVTFYSHRRHWPSRLFRHEPLENILPILNSGSLLSRNQAGEDGAIINDIAPADIINANVLSHQYVRLYFRPKTPTQFHIEGIREAVDFFMGKHAPVLYMMVFDAEKILTTPGVRFSDGNMQGHPNVYEGDAGFGLLDFENIYHEGAVPLDDRAAVTRARCAEVLCPSPLLLPPYLQAVICRSAAERQLLLHELGPHFEGKERVRVFNEAGVFNADYVFVESVDLASDGLHVQFHAARRGSPTGEVEIRLRRLDRPAPPVRWHKLGLEFWKKWHFTHNIPDGHYLIEITIRNCLAYRSMAILESVPF